MSIGRGTKRLIIIFIYFAIFLLIVWLFYSAFRTNPTCFDEVQNQNEAGVDCGGVCDPCHKEPNVSDIIVDEKAFIFGGQNKYDVLVKIKNPNDFYGIDAFSYKISLRDSGGNVLYERTGEDFILPKETKYIIETNLETNSEPQDVIVEIGDSNWEEFSDYEPPKLNIYNKRYNDSPDGPVFSEAYGLLRNESPFDFNVISVNVVLRDGGNVPIAVGKTEMRTVNSSEQRDFKVQWPNSFPGEVAKVEMEAEADVFDSENFIIKHLPKRKFQEY